MLIYFFLLITTFLSADNLERIYQALPALKEASYQTVNGGWTNSNYKVSLEEQSLFIRCNASHSQLIDASFEREWAAATLFAEAKLSPQPLYYSPEHGVMVFEYLETVPGEINTKDPSTLKACCDLIRSMHELPVQLSDQFSPYEAIQLYLNNGFALDAPFPDVIFEQILPSISELKEIYPLSPILVPCHFDLHHGNFLNDGERLWLIDFEYSGMGDPLFDLATLASSDHFSDDELIIILNSYFNNETISKELINKFRYFRLLADLRWAVWYYLQSKACSTELPYIQMGDLLIGRILKTLATV